MDPEIKELLRRNLKISEDSNVLLHKMHRSAVRSSIMRAIYWIIIIGSGVVSYYYLQPYISKVLALYNDVQAGAAKVKSYGF